MKPKIRTAACGRRADARPAASIASRISRRDPRVDRRISPAPPGRPA